MLTLPGMRYLYQIRSFLLLVFLLLGAVKFVELKQRLRGFQAAYTSESLLLHIRETSMGG